MTMDLGFYPIANCTLIRAIIFRNNEDTNEASGVFINISLEEAVYARNAIDIAIQLLKDKAECQMREQDNTQIDPNPRQT